MDFKFYRSDPNLTKSVAMGGCGVPATDVNGVTRWQQQDGYYFHYHTGYHGEGQSHYVYVHEGTKGKSMCRIFINGSKAFTTADCGYMKKKNLDDAVAVVRANADLFLGIAQRQ